MDWSWVVIIISLILGTLGNSWIAAWKSIRTLQVNAFVVQTKKEGEDE